MTMHSYIDPDFQWSKVGLKTQCEMVTKRDVLKWGYSKTVASILQGPNDLDDWGYSYCSKVPG